MDRPRLRPIEAFPVQHNGQMLLAFRDPSGIGKELVLQPLGVAMVELCNGERTRDEICAEFTRKYNRALSRGDLDALLQKLDDSHLLDSDGFRTYSANLFGEFARSPVRPAQFAGKAYPGVPAELSRFLDESFTPPNGPGRPQPGSGALPKALIAPHIDFHRGAPAYAWAYQSLAAAPLDALPELVVVFGTDHAGSENAFTLTRKHYQTPLGQMETDIPLIDKLCAAVEERLGPGRSQIYFRDEHHHRGEHSLEFQMVWLRHLWGENAANVKVLPVLCGSLHEFVDGDKQPGMDERIAVFLEELKKLTEGKRVLYIAGADLAHVGPHFARHGDFDASPLDKDDRQSLEKRDQESLKPVLRGDAQGWFDEIRREKDRRRVCGLPPIYAMLRSADVHDGKLLVYAQCPADERGGSLVSIASLIFA
jgi:AmmeMemoRadiSam system protein B